MSRSFKEMWDYAAGNALVAAVLHGIAWLTVDTMVTNIVLKDMIPAAAICCLSLAFFMVVMDRLLAIKHLETGEVLLACTALHFLLLALVFIFIKPPGTVQAITYSVSALHLGVIAFLVFLMELAECID